jgi:HAE1 family hydrophobic/amphiphilic exporter-1
MIKIGACWLLSGLVSAAVAQTSAPPGDPSPVIVFPPVILPDSLPTNAPARPLSLPDCIAEALQHNFDVRVERYAPEEAQLSLAEAYAGYDPTLNIAGQHNYNHSGGEFLNGLLVPSQISDENYFNSSLGGSLPSGMQYTLSGNVGESYGATGGSPFDSTSGNIGVNFTQPLLKNLWIDGTRLAITSAKNQLKQSVQGLRAQLITTVSAVENAYFELIYAIENVTVQEQALYLAQTQLDQDRQRVQVGSLAPLDVQQDQAQVAQSKANLISAVSTLGTDQRVLKNLITDEYSTTFAADIQPTMTLDAPLQLFDLQDSWSKGMTERPDLLQARLTLEQQGIQLKYDRNQLFPELDLVGSYGFNGTGKEFSDAFGQYAEGNRPFYSYGGQLSVPLSNLKARSVLKADKAVEQQDLLKLKQLEQNILVEIDNAVGVARSDYESVQATKEARIYAEAALDAEQRKYAVGKSTTFTVLQLQNTLTSDRAAEIRALANYQEALTALAQQEGSTLERRNVTVTAK